MPGSSAGSCWWSASITATTGAAVAHIPSIAAEASPRRPIRSITRTRRSRTDTLPPAPPPPRLLTRDRPGLVGGAVGAVVVDEDRFPAVVPEHDSEPLDQLA